MASLCTPIVVVEEMHDEARLKHAGRDVLENIATVIVAGATIIVAESSSATVTTLDAVRATDTATP